MMFFKLPNSEEYLNLNQIVRITQESEHWIIVLTDGNRRIVSKTTVPDLFKLLQKANKNAAFVGLTVLEL